MDGHAVLVGIDFSGPGARALEEARRVAGTLAVGTELVHVTPSGRGWRPAADERAWMERAGIDPSELRIREGTPWVELARHATERACLLIAIGSHGRGGYHPVSLGSTAHRLTMAASRPVLVVGQRIAAPAQGAGVVVG